MRFFAILIFVIGCETGSLYEDEYDTDSEIDISSETEAVTFEIATPDSYEEVCDDSGLCWSKPFVAQYWPYRWELIIDQPDIPFFDELECPDYFGGEWRIPTEDEYYKAATGCTFGAYTAVQNQGCSEDPLSDECSHPVGCKPFVEFDDLAGCTRVIDCVYEQIVCGPVTVPTGYHEYFARCVREQ